MFSRRRGTIGKTVLVAAFAAVALLIPASAQAAQTRIEIYGVGAYTPTKALAFGQVFSSKRKCVDGRRFKLVVGYPNRRNKVTDTGRASEEGAIAGRATFAQLEDADDLFFKVGPAKVGDTRCRRARESVSSSMRAQATAARTFDSDITILGVDGEDNDGAYVGFVTSEKPKCIRNRKLVLSSEGDVLDRGRTSQGGVWALHITAAQSDLEIKVAMRKSRLGNGDRCGRAQRHRRRHGA